MKLQCTGRHELCWEVVCTTMQKIQKTSKHSSLGYCKNIFRKQDLAQAFLSCKRTLLRMPVNCICRVLNITGTFLNHINVSAHLCFISDNLSGYRKDTTSFNAHCHFQNQWELFINLLRLSNIIYAFMSKDKYMCISICTYLSLIKDGYVGP